MDPIQLSRVVLLSMFWAVAYSASANELADRHSMLTTDTFRFLEKLFRAHQSMLEERLRRLEARVSYLETGSPGLRPPGEDYGPPYIPHIPEEFLPERHPVTVRTITEPVTFQYDASCARIYNNGYIRSGQYTIDPDGSGYIPPFTVYCDMDAGQGITIVGHDSEQIDMPVNGFENPGSFVLKPNYLNGATMVQLGALADASKYCTQYVKYRCKNSAIMAIEPRTGLTYGWWVDRNGHRRVNFGGAPTDSGLCSCAIDRSCYNDMPTCSCDHERAKNQADEGYFNDKKRLPVMSINLGDTGSKKERGAITLGKFICSG